jgi:signal peptide peptidase SppA
MKDYSQIITKVTSTPWMITPDALRIILEVLDAHISGQITTEQATNRVRTARQGMGFDFDMGDDGPLSRRVGSVGVLNLTGPIFPKANLMTNLSGATSLDQFQAEFRKLILDDNVRSILLNVDSPGGLSDLVDEMATEIHQGRSQKPIYSVANTTANSAAYYLASQADKMYSTPSGQVGSIGTFMVHSDDSKQKEMMGVTDTVVKSGRFKAVGMEPLTGESLSHLQEFVNQTNDGFVSAVARGRNVEESYVRENYGEGGVVSPKRALEVGMIDGIATFDEVLNSLNTGGVTSISNTGYATSTSGNMNISTSGNTNVYIPVAPGLKQSYDADKEHSEPGTGLGGEPTPRIPRPEDGDPAIEGGWRRDPPPIAYETEEMAVNREWMEARAAVLGIDFTTEMADADLAELIQSRIDEIVVPLNNATADAQKQREFEVDFPDQAKQLAELTAKNTVNEAAAFADNFAKFEGTTKGYSTLVRDKIEDAHLKIAARQFTQQDLQELLEAASSKEAVVEWGETGSSRTREDSSVAPSTDFAEARQQFAELVRSAMTEDSLTQSAAIEHVSKQNPELAQAYLHGHR